MILIIDNIQTQRPSQYNPDQWFRTVEFTGEDGNEYITYVDNDMKNYKDNWDSILRFYDDDPSMKIIVQIPNFKLKKDNIINADRKVHIDVDLTKKANGL